MAPTAKKLLQENPVLRDRSRGAFSLLLSLEQAKKVRQIIFLTTLNILPESIKAIRVKPLKVVNPDLSGPLFKRKINNLI